MEGILPYIPSNIVAACQNFYGRFKEGQKYRKFMRAFVTGGTGFIGSHLVDHLLQNPEVESVNCLIRSNEKWLAGKNISRVKGDLHDIEALKKGMENSDVVFHLAARTSAPDRDAFHAANVDATENIVRTAQKAGIRKLIILSSLASTGPSFGRPVTEEDPLMPVSMYGESKKKMEEMVHRIADPALSVSILKPPAVYGPREEQIYQVFKSASRGLFPIIGDGKSVRLSLIHVRDVVSGIMLAFKQCKPGVHTYFISSEELYTWEQIKEVITRQLGRKSFSLKLSPKLVKRAAGVIEGASSVFGHYPVINRDKANELVMEWTCAVEKAQRELHYAQQVTLEEGVSETIAWYKRHKWL